jgi:hypothetical protein
VRYHVDPAGGHAATGRDNACYLKLSALRARLKLADCVVDHVFKGTFQGDERGLVCHEHWDAIIGDYESCSDRPVVQ